MRQPALLGVAVLFGLLVRFAAGVLPPAIGGSLLGVFLSGLAHAIQRRTPLADRQAYTLPLLAGLLLFIPAAWRLAPA